MGFVCLGQHRQGKWRTACICATGMRCRSRECVCVQEGDTLCASYKASGSCYGHILITRSVLDYVLWACNITPSGRSPSGSSVSWLLAGKKKNISGDSPKHCFQFCSTCENGSSHMILVQRYPFAVLSASARRAASPSYNEESSRFNRP